MPREKNKQTRTGYERLPIIIGYDGEVANYIEGLDLPNGTGKEAARKIIREIKGYPDYADRFLRNCPCDACDTHRRRRSHGGWGGQFGQSGWVGYNEYGGQDGYGHYNGWSAIAASALSDLSETADTRQSDYDPRDHDRRYLAATGGCIYIDLDHIELCLPEARSAFDHVACWHASLRILRQALDAANNKMPEGQKIHVLINNSDGFNHSYGTHMNFLVTRKCWSEIFERRMQYLLYLAAYQVSSIIFTGQGKVGSENRCPHVDFQISQRADFFEQLTGQQTTYARPIVNSRDEPLCGTREFLRAHPDGPEARMARLHVIFYDATLCHVSTFLKAGVMQIILAMIEAGNVNLKLILEDPITALKVWSHDPALRSKARMCSGRATTAVDLQSRFVDEAKRFVDRGGCEGIVPHAGDIMSVWADTIEKLRARDYPALSRRLDWVLKKTLLEEVLEDNPQMDWTHAAIKQLDHFYSSLDLDEGLFWSFESDDHIERMVSESDIERFVSNPPLGTRAHRRAFLLGSAREGRVSAVDWDHIEFVDGEDESTFEHRTVDLANPIETPLMSECRDLIKRTFDSEVIDGTLAAVRQHH
ncbi:MAG: proteasome accessory factor PafA2 family protein [Candidatus Latescibacterota bacterium]|nr:MAG: proteasome accessory factor PafA2 family protein [Candidatus Latescibacterota bacterium]